MTSIATFLSEQRLLLNNSNAARTMSIGSSWTKLRLGFRICIDYGGSGVNITGTPRLYLGLLSNPTANLSNGPLGPDTSHFVGLCTGTSTWTEEGTGNYHAGGTFAEAIKVGSTLSIGTPGSGGVFRPRFQASYRGIIIVLIEKGATWKVGVVFPSTTNHFDLTGVQLGLAMGISTSVADFDTQGNDILTALNGYAGVAAHTWKKCTTTLAVDETANGSLNALCVGWDRALVNFHFSDIAYAKVA